MEQKIFKIKAQSLRNNRKWQKTVFVNTALLVVGATTSISGLIIQCHYHLLKSANESAFWGLNRSEWNAIHVWTSLFFFLITIYHLSAHRKWYENVFKQRILAKHRPTILLTVLMIIVTLSGLMPLFIQCLDGNSIARSSIIEIHDKIAILFLIVVFRHTIKRFKWYANIIRNKFQ